MKKNIHKPVRVISFLLIIIPTLLWLVYFNIDHIPWVSKLFFRLSVEHTIDKITYSASPYTMATGTRYEVLSTVMNITDKYGWRTTFSTDNLTVLSYFGNDGVDAGGVIVIGPALVVSTNNSSTSENLDEYYFQILDITEFCGDTPKSKVCTNNPFKGFTKLFLGLCAYTFVSFIVSTILLMKSFQYFRQEKTIT